MTYSRSAVFLVALALLRTPCGNAGAQKVDMPSTSTTQPVLSLNFANNGQHVAATVGQQIEITRGTVGGPYYGTPQVSSRAIRLEGVASVGPYYPSMVSPLPWWAGGTGIVQGAEQLRPRRHVRPASDAANAGRRVGAE